MKYSCDFLIYISCDSYSLIFEKMQWIKKILSNKLNLDMFLIIHKYCCHKMPNNFFTYLNSLKENYASHFMVGGK